MCDAGDIAAAVVTSTPQDYSASTMRTTQAGTCSCILCDWSREISCFLGGRGITCNGSSFAIHLLRRPSHLLVQYPSHGLQSGCLLGGTFDDGIQIHHVHANVLARQPLLFAAFHNCLVPFGHYSVCCPQSSSNHSMTFLFSSWKLHRFVEGSLPPVDLWGFGDGSRRSEIEATIGD
jgi:hypothetical protein